MTQKRLSNMIRMGLVLGGALFGLSTTVGFLGTSNALRKIDAQYSLTREQRTILNNERLMQYDSSSLPIKVLDFGCFLAYKFYNESLERGLVEGVSQ